MNIKIANALLSLALIALLGNCTNKTETDFPYHEDNRYRDYLLDAGFPEESISECGDNFVLEDEMVISKDEIQRLIDVQEADKHALHRQAVVGDRQRVAGTSLISIANVENISVYVDPSMASVGGVDYRPWINLALSRWSAGTSGARINFPVASSHSTADLTFIRNNAGAGISNPSLPVCLSSSGWPGSNPAAVSLLPASGNAGRFISIRSDYAGSNSGRVALLMHEIGHALGFRHDASSSEGNTSPCGELMQNILLNGTQDNEATTVMRTPVSSSNTSLSTNDKLAARLLYPPSYHVPTITSVTQYNATLNKVTIAPVSPYYYRVILEVSRVSDGAIMSTLSWNAVNNLQYPIQRPTTPGLYRVRLYGENFGGDFQSGWSSYFNFTI